MVQSGKQLLVIEPLCVLPRFVDSQTLRDETMGIGDFVDSEPWDIIFHFGSLPQARPALFNRGIHPQWAKVVGPLLEEHPLLVVLLAAFLDFVLLQRIPKFTAPGLGAEHSLRPRTHFYACSEPFLRRVERTRRDDRGHWGATSSPTT